MKFPAQILAFVLVSLFWSCDTEKIEPSQECLYTAVVEDFTGLDGCGYLFKLGNGEYLEPVWRWGWCGTPPLPEGYYNDPLRNFQFEHGKNLRIGFEYTNDYSSICMKGKPVIVTCIKTIGMQPYEIPAE